MQQLNLLKLWLQLQVLAWVIKKHESRENPTLKLQLPPPPSMTVFRASVKTESVIQAAFLIRPIHFQKPFMESVSVQPSQRGPHVCMKCEIMQH